MGNKKKSLYVKIFDREKDVCFYIKFVYVHSTFSTSKDSIVSTDKVTIYEN